MDVVRKRMSGYFFAESFTGFLKARWGFRCIIGSALACACVTPLPAQAGAYLFHFGNVFSGSGPVASAPWMDTLFEDTGSGAVRLTIANVGLTGSENVKAAYFNLDPALDPTALSFTWVSSSGSFDLPTIVQGVNAFKSDGDGYFDLELAFNNDGQSDSSRFTAGEQVGYDISGILGLKASDFVFLSEKSGGQGMYYASAHVQRIMADPTSGWIGAIPEPSPNLLGALGMSLWLCFRLSQRRGKSTSGLKTRPAPFEQ